MQPSAVGGILRLAALALTAWFLAAATWVVTETRVPRPDSPAATSSPEAAVVRASTIARGLSLHEELAVAKAVEVPEAPRTKTVDTPLGRFEYSRELNVVATYYTPANGGKAPGSPAYGITATGARATRGIVAVDPRVIPLYSWLYVPGYGVAQARDVGRAIIGNHIDVAFDDGDGAWWGRRYLTVFVLAR